MFTIANRAPVGECAKHEGTPPTTSCGPKVLGAVGTATVPRVDKIVGPGNRYVAVAKALVSRYCAIDFFAGPTEIVIVAGAGRAEWIAADLVAQAEHDPDARSIFITWSASLAARVASRAGTEAQRR